MTIFVSDTFTGVSGTELSAYNANWSKQTGNTIAANIGTTVPNTAYGTSNASYAIYQRSETPASADYSVFGDAIQRVDTTEQIGVTGRASTSADTCYLTLQVNVFHELRLYKRVAGSLTQLGTGFSNTMTNGVAQNHELRMSGTSISVYLDGVARCGSPVTDSAISATGKAGIIVLDGAFTESINLDNFSGVDGGGATPTNPYFYRVVGGMAGAQSGGM